MNTISPDKAPVIHICLSFGNCGCRDQDPTAETPEVLKALSLCLSVPLSICLSVCLCLSPPHPLSFLSLFCHLFIVFLHLFMAVIILFEKARLKKQIKVNERGKQKLEKQTFYQKAKLAKTIMGNTPRIQFRNF